MEKTTELQTDLTLEVLAQRRAIYPDRFNSQEITPEEVRQLLEAARYAPTHKLTEPWRFHVVMGASKTEMTVQVRDFIKNRTDNLEKGARMAQKMEQSQAVIVVAFQRDLRERVPEWEEIAATSMAVQNIWIYANALNMGGYWSTGAPGVEAFTHLLDLDEGEVVLGLFFLGRHNFQPRPRPSKPVNGFTTWRL